VSFSRRVRSQYLAKLHKNCKLYCQQLHLKYLCNLARYWLQAPWGWHNSVETCRSVIICEIVVHLLVTVQNIYDLFNNDCSVALTVQHRIIAEECPGEGKPEICNREIRYIEEECKPIGRDVRFCGLQSSEETVEAQITLQLTTRKSVHQSVRLAVGIHLGLKVVFTKHPVWSLQS